MLIVIPILIFVALVIVGAGVKIVPRVSVDGRAIWPLYQNAATGLKHRCAVHGPGWPQNQYDGAGAGYSLAGSDFER